MISLIIKNIVDSEFDMGETIWWICYMQYIRDIGTTKIFMVYQGMR